MRNIGLVSAAVIAMAAMAGAVAASAPPVMQSQPPIDRRLLSGSAEVSGARVENVMGEILSIVGMAEDDGLSGEPAQQRIKRHLQDYLHHNLNTVGRLLSEEQLLITLIVARRELIDTNQLRSGSDGDLAISALEAEQEAGWRADRNNRAGRNPFGGTGTGGRGAGAGQPATNAGTTGIRRSRATYDSDLAGPRW